MKQAIKAGALAAALLIVVVAAAQADPLLITIGDNDGYGPVNSIADNADASWGSFVPQDWRSAGEAAATNGAQQTDYYGALQGTFIPNAFDIIFPLAGTLNSGTFVIDMADFQVANTVTAKFNGVLQPGLLNFSDGFQKTRVRSFALSAAAVANANLAGQFVVRLEMPVYNDFVAFDFFQLRGDISPNVVPEPSSLALIGGVALLGLGLRRRASKKAS